MDSENYSLDFFSTINNIGNIAIKSSCQYLSYLSVSNIKYNRYPICVLSVEHIGRIYVKNICVNNLCHEYIMISTKYIVVFNYGSVSYLCTINITIEDYTMESGAL